MAQFQQALALILKPAFIFTCEMSTLIAKRHLAIRDDVIDATTIVYVRILSI